MAIQEIKPAALYNLSEESGGGLAIVDVREPDEYAALHASVGTNQPLSAMSRGELGHLERMRRDEPLYLLCRSGQRSLRACALLREQGFVALVNVTGGILAWQADGLPVVREDTP
jgi:rhodanese-related sulfurtransferase